MNLIKIIKVIREVLISNRVRTGRCSFNDKRQTRPFQTILNFVNHQVVTLILYSFARFQKQVTKRHKFLQI